MIWFNYKRLELCLKNQELSERAAFQYLLLNLFLIALILKLPTDNEFDSEIWNLGDFFLDIIITFWGTYIAFNLNRKGSSHDFLKSYLSLSFVHGFRLAIFYSLLALIYKIIMFVIPLDLWYPINDFTTGNAGKLIINIGISLIFYYFLLKSFKRIN